MYLPSVVIFFGFTHSCWYFSIFSALIGNVDKKLKRLKKYELFSEVTDIYLFDSKGYEKSLAFDHELIQKIKINKPLMLAGNIQINDNLENYKKIADIIDISGGLETSGIKDKSKIDIFLNKVEQIKNET